MYRIGNGFDVHQLREGLPMILGGVNIEHDKGFVAHSDGDVLIHSLCDALLGAVGEGDIGLHFPDTDPKYKGIRSTELLNKVMQIVLIKGYELVNCDCTIIAERPKLRPLIDVIRENMAKEMGIEISQISLKATTSEKLGYVGREEGVAVICTVLLKQVCKDEK